MQALKEQAIEFIKTIPDDKLVYVMEMFKGIEGLLNDSVQAEQLAQKRLLDEVKGLRGIVRNDIDEKAELAEARDEKYASIG